MAGGKEFEFGFKIAAFLQGNFKASFGSANKEISALNEKIRENKALLKAAEKDYKAGTLSEEAYKSTTTGLTARLGELNEQQRAVMERQAGINKLGAKSMGAFAKGAALGGAAQGMFSFTQSAIQFESAMADVRKTVDFDTPQQFKQMSSDILELSTRLPMTANGLAAIVAAGGQSGIARDELTSFAESAAKMGIAFDISADQAGEMMAKWRTAFGMNQKEVITLADQVNYLSNVTAASSNDISDIVTRVGPLGEVAGINAGQIAALGASMAGVGVQSEIAATGIKNMALGLVSGESATKSQIAAFAKLGLSATDVAKRMQEDAQGTIIDVLTRLRQLPKEVQASTMKDLFGSESLSAIAPLLTQLDTLQTNFKRAGEAAQYAGSMEKEFEARAGTTANSLILMNNRMDAAKIAITNGLLPVIVPLAEGVGTLATAIGGAAMQYPTLTKAIVVGTAAVIAFGAAGNFAKGIFYGGKWLAGSISVLLRHNAQIRQGIILTRGWAVAQTVFNGAAGATRAVLGSLGAGFRALWAIIMANPWMALAAVAIGAGLLIYNNWDTIKQWFTTLWEDPELALQQFCDGVRNYLGGIFDWVSEKWESLKSLLSSPISGNVSIAASGGGPVAQNATGGVYRRGAFLTSFAEKSGESAIPHTPNRRNIGLLAQTNRIMGNPLGQGTNITATFAPQITVTGGSADVAAIDTLMEQKMQEFEALLKRVAAQQRRLSYE